MRVPVYIWSRAHLKRARAWHCLLLLLPSPPQHVPVEKTFERIVRRVGERVLEEAVEVEHLGARVYEVERARGTACPTGPSPAGAGGERVAERVV